MVAISTTNGVENWLRKITVPLLLQNKHNSCQKRVYVSSCPSLDFCFSSRELGVYSHLSFSKFYCFEEMAELGYVHFMHPELLNNPTFLRYNEMWQCDPGSLAFAPLADFFCSHKLYADARRVCEAGVKHHPHSVLAHYSLAKAYLFTREWHAARHEAQWVLSRVSNHPGALEVLQQVDRHQVPARHMIVQPEVAKVMERSGGSSPIAVVEIANTAKMTGQKPIPWQTITMAKIYSQQGLYFKARTIYRAILSRDPQNNEAKAGLTTLEREMKDARDAAA